MLHIGYYFHFIDREFETLRHRVICLSSCDYELLTWNIQRSRPAPTPKDIWFHLGITLDIWVEILSPPRACKHLHFQVQVEEVSTSPMALQCYTRCFKPIIF